jgi:hypothetical protein
MRQRIFRKRPCRVCRRWFRPDPRQKERQYVCGDEDCQRERHRRNCEDWHRRNPDYDRETRLRSKLKKGKERGKYAEPSQGINWERARDAIGLELLVVIDEVAKVTLDLARDALLPQRLVIKGKSHRLIPSGSRDTIDPGKPPP